jgi:DNA-binding MarR family transcriptional regulator
MNHFHGGSDAQRLGRLLHQLRGVLGPAPEDVVGIDLPRHQLRALFVVAKTGPISVSGLAAATDASLASASSLADRLARSGHLERAPDATDRRRVLLTVTPSGQGLVDRLEIRFHDRFERLVGAMSPAARSALETGLNDMIRAADELGMRSTHTPPHHHPGDHA